MITARILDIHGRNTSRQVSKSKRPVEAWSAGIIESIQIAQSDNILSVPFREQEHPSYGYIFASQSEPLGVRSVKYCKAQGFQLPRDRLCARTRQNCEARDPHSRSPSVLIDVELDSRYNCDQVEPGADHLKSHFCTSWPSTDQSFQ